MNKNSITQFDSLPVAHQAWLLETAYPFQKLNPLSKDQIFIPPRVLRISPEVSSQKCGSKWWEPQNPTVINKCIAPKGTTLISMFKKYRIYLNSEERVRNLI